MLSEESMIDILVFGIEVIEDDVGVAWVTGCEDDHFEVFAEVFKDLLGVRADVDACLDDLASGESYRKFYIVRWSERIVAMNQGFVEIEDHWLFT